MYSLGDLVELEIGKVAHGGVFVARLGADAESRGRVVFVPDVLPGERVRARISDTSKDSFWRAEACEVLDASVHRRAHVWPEADIDRPPHGRPGGAEFGHIDVAEQRALKAQVLSEALQRFAGTQLPVTVAPPRAGEGSLPTDLRHGLRWRTRVSMHVDDEGNVGPFAARSHRVVQVGELPLATEQIADVARTLDGEPGGRLDLVQPADGRVRVLPRAQDGNRVGKGAREVVTEIVAGREFQLAAGGFWQVHPLAAATLTATVAELLDTEPFATALDEAHSTHLDLYGGVGLFAAALAARAHRSASVISVESDARATRNATINLADWPGARAETGRVDRWLRAADRVRKPGVIVLDPPRSGAGAEVLRAVDAWNPTAVIYVACDPIALARDVATLAAVGYQLISVSGWDLFPHTHHLEAVAAFVRSDKVSA